jgi:hypothetical protein
MEAEIDPVIDFARLEYVFVIDAGEGVCEDGGTDD